MQNITIAGRLGRDAETRSTQDGTPVCSFSVAVDYRAGREKATNWYRVSLWGQRGSALAQHLTKGTVVSVSGEFSLSEYEGKPQLNVRADQVSLLGGGQQDDRNRSANADRQQARGNGGPQQRYTEDEDSIPFLRNDTVW